jgi:hypothetical protein
MAAVPRSTNTVTVLEVGNIFADFNDITDDFMTGNAGKDIAKVACAHIYVRETDTTGEDLDEDLTL